MAWNCSPKNDRAGNLSTRRSLLSVGCTNVIRLAAAGTAACGRIGPPCRRPLNGYDIGFPRVDKRPSDEEEPPLSVRATTPDPGDEAAEAARGRPARKSVPCGRLRLWPAGSPKGARSARPQCRVATDADPIWSDREKCTCFLGRRAARVFPIRSSRNRPRNGLRDGSAIRSTAPNRDPRQGRVHGASSSLAPYAAPTTWQSNSRGNSA